MDNTISKLRQKYALRLISRLLRKGGKLVSPEHKEERKNTCLGCPHMGKVQVPVNGIKVSFDEGCTLCGCPLETKTQMETLMRDPENIGRPYTATELVTSQLTNKSYIEEKVKCTDAKNGNDRWKATDQKYAKLSQ